jgi:hypothetical protein
LRRHLASPSRRPSPTSPKARHLPDVEGLGWGWVKLIWKDWTREDLDSRDDRFGLIEDFTVKEVGWSRVAYEYVMIPTYRMIRGRHDWYTEYRRPPVLIEP